MKAIVGEGWRKGFMAVCCMALLSACSPEYNWRQVAVAEGRVAALFPAKPSTEQRDLVFEDRQLTFSMTQARVGDDTYAVAYAPWGPEFRDDARMRERIGHEVLLSLYRNFQLAPPETLPAMGEAFELRGGPEGELWLRARIWLTSYGLVQGMILTRDGGPDDQAKVFFDALANSIGETRQVLE